MKHTKRVFALVLCVALCLGLMLTGCNSGDELSADATYKVTVVDGLGNVYTEKVIVKLLQNGKQVAMGPINEQGVYEKVLPRGDYTVEVAGTNTALDCYFIGANLTAEVVEAKVVMAYAPTEFDSISAPSLTEEGNLSCDAALVSAGSSYIELVAGERTYVLFTPKQAGTYEFSVTNDDASVGYYGGPHYVQSNNVADMDGNKFSMSIDSGMINTEGSGTTVLVIGLDAEEGKDGCILNINRVGDPAWSINDEPWIKYQAKAAVNSFTLASGVKLIPFDLTASTDAYKLVLNTEDGTYHLGAADGPKVYVQLSEAIYGISMKDMVGEIVYDSEGILIPTGTSPFRYQRGETKDDCFKEDYTDFMREVVTAADKGTGVYPLTEDLFYVLPMGIDNKGWAREGTANYLFNGTDVNPDLAWMFMLCHADGAIPEPKPDDSNNGGSNGGSTTTPTGPVEDNKEEPIVIGSTLNFDAEVKANHIVYFDLLKVNDTTLTIKSKDAYVVYNGITYEAVNGVVTVPNLYSQYTNIPVSIKIGNKGSKDATFAVSLTYPEGHRENPVEMSLKSFSVSVKKNNEQGVYYHWSVAKAGTLTISMDKVTSTSGAVEASISVTVTGADMIPHQYLLSEVEGNSLVVEVAAGDDVVINIGVLPNAQNRYLAATVDVTASFA